MKIEVKNAVPLAFRMTLPVMAGYIFLGLTFGLLTKTSGFAFWVPILMSGVIYSGALEFAAVPLLSAAFDPIGAFVLSVTLSARHLFYGIPLLKKYEGTGKIKPFLIFGLTDETFSILSGTEAGEAENPKKLYFFVTLFDFLYWTSGTALGALIGSAVKVDLKGLDFVLTALFIVLFLEQIKTKKGLKSGIAGVVLSLTALLIFGKTNFVIISMAFIITVLLGGRRVIDNE